jgi:tetratricopeptide (TPR) repeat protein
MEVAMHSSLNRASHSFLAYFATTALLLALTGCSQEIISHNDDSRRQGIEQFNQKNYADAAGAFRNAARQDPRDYKSLYYLGASYERMGQFHQAIEAYKSAMDSQPSTLAGQEDEAGRLRTMDAMASLIGRGDARDAETNLVEQRAKSTQAAADYFLLAKIYRYRGDVDSATDAYNRALLKNPKDFSVSKEYGLYLEQLGQKQRAEAALRKAYAMRSADNEVAEGLRRLGVVPGPKGPIPPVSEMRIPGFGGSNNNTNNTPAQPAAETVQAPRD